jgi:RND family efflux transporter MFP subunit
VADASGLAERVFPGRVRAAREVNLSFRVSGPLITLPVKVGDTVSAGDVLATLDPTDFQNRLATVEGELSTARAQAALAQREWERGRDIDARGGNLISKSELDKRRGARDRSRAQVQALTGSLQLARDQLSYTTLRAPFDGVVVAKYVENFEDVVAKRPVVRLVDASAIEVDIDVPEGLIGYAPYVESVELRFDALPELELTAQIKEVGREASQTCAPTR